MHVSIRISHHKSLSIVRNSSKQILIDRKMTNCLFILNATTELVTTVSCGGNILVNVGPSKTGLIDPIFVERLLDMGHWLNMNGEAIYGSTPWKYQNDAIVSGVWYTKSKQIENNRGIVYAIVLEYPYDTNNIVLGSMSSITDKNTNVKMIGSPFSLKVRLNLICSEKYLSDQHLYILFFSGTQPTQGYS